MSICVDNLISAVFRRTALWDQRHKFHHNRYVLDKLWTEVANELKRTSSSRPTIKGIRTKWKNLRDKFRLEVRKTNIPLSDDDEDRTSDPFFSEWQYFDQLRFLIDQFPSQQSNGNSGFQSVNPTALDPEVLLNIKEESVSDCSPSGASLCSLNSIKSPEENSTEANSSQKRKREFDFDDKSEESDHQNIKVMPEDMIKKVTDKNMVFFTSLLPHINKLSDERQLLLQIEIQNLVHRHVYSER